MQLASIVRRVLRAKPTHILGIAVCAFALGVVVVSGRAGPTSRPHAAHTFRGPVELLPVITTPGGLVIVPGPVCSSISHQPVRKPPRCP
jgi:hypothetical protein